MSPIDYTNIEQVQRVVRLGLYFRDKYRRRAEDAGVQVAAAQLRKQGVPLGVALGILAPSAPKPTVTYRHKDSPENCGRFRQNADDPLPSWAVDVRIERPSYHNNQELT